MRGRQVKNDNVCGRENVEIVPTDEEEIVDHYRSFFKGIFGYCTYRLFSKDLAEDATCEVFLRLVEKYPDLRSRSRTGIRNWLYGTASNVAAIFLHDAKKWREIAAELGRQRKSTFTDGAPGGEGLDWPVVYEAINRLRSRDQEIIALRYFQELEISAIAEALGIKHVTVRVRLSRAVKRLRRKLGKSVDRSHETT